MIEQDINERMARFAPSQAGPDVDPIAAEIAARASIPSAQPTMQEASGVDPVAMQIATRNRESMNAAVLGARSVNPDEATRAEQLGQRIGIGPEIARADMARAEQQAYLMDLRAKDYPRTDPILANYLENRQFAETAHDDLGVLEMVKPLLLEAAMIQARGAPALFDAVSRGYQRGKKQMELGEMKALGMVRFPTPQEREDIANLTKEIQDLGRGGAVGIGAEMIGQYAANLKEIGAFSAGGAAIGSVIPGVGTAIGGGLGLAAGILKTGGTPVAGNLYNTLNEKGVSDDIAIPAAIAGGFLGGLVEVVGGKIAAMPVQALAKRVMAETLSEALTRPTLQQAAKEFVKAYGLQVGGETFEEGTQAISEMLSEEIALAASGIDSELTMREGFMRVIESALYGAAGSAILGGVGPGANLLIDLRRASNTERQTNVFEDLAANRKESKYANRNPVGYERFLASQAEGTTAETIYVDGRIAQQVLAQSGVPTAQLEEILPGIRERISEAVQTGGDVTIPTARFGARLANTDLGNALLPHMRLSPDAMSATEAQEFATRRQEVVREAEQILAQKQEADGAFVAEARDIYNDVRRQAMEAGQDSDVADVAASLYQAFVVTQAAEQNMTPAQFQAAQGVRGIQGIMGEMAPMAAAPTPRMEIAPGVMAPARPAGMTSAAYERLILGEFEAPAIPSADVATIQTQTDAASTSIDQSSIPAKAKSGLGISVKQIGTALRQGNAVELANALWKLRERMSKLETIPAELQALAASIEERLASLGITIEVPQIGAEDRGGQEVERVSVMPNKDSAQVFDRIKTVMAPVVRRNGAVISRGQVVVEAGAEAFEAQRAAALDVETQRVDAEINERMARIRQAAAAPGVMEQAAIAEATQIDAQAEAISDDDVVTAESQPEIPQSIDDAIALESVARLATGRTWERGRDLKVAMQQEAGRLAGEAGVNLSLDTPQTAEYLKRIGVRDALYALRQNPNSVGWYDEKTRQAIAVMSLVHPELLKDENARFAFTWALAVTSNGIKVDKNFELANAAYSQYKRDGKMPTDLTAGQAQAAINRSLGMFNELVDAWGIDNVRKFTQTEYTIQELRYLVQDFDAGGEFASTVVKGAGILGPKIGNGFFSNLYGDFRSLTMDRWLIRTWGRWTGTLIKEMPVQTERARVRLDTVVQTMNPAQRADLGAVLREYADGSPEFIDAFEAGEAVDLGMLAALVQKASMDVDGRARMNATETGQEFRKAGNSLAKYLDGQKEAPSGPKERVQIRGVFGEILRELQQLPEYADLTMADLQAALWYAEKRLYETAREDIQVDEESIEGYADEEAPDYANAAAKVARASGVSEKQIASTLKKESNDERSRRARSQDAAGRPVVARDTGAVRGFTASEKRRFNGAAVIRGQRANRGAVAGSPRAYERRGREATAKPRLVKKIGAKIIAEYGPARRLRNALKVVGDSEKQFGTPNFFELEKSAKSAEAFHKRIMQSKAQNDFGASVFAYPVNEYEDMRLFLSDDGTSGFALKGDDIVSVFSMSDQSMLHALMEMAVSAGGRRLDAFDTVLPHFYAPHGFRAVARLRWDDAQAPAGWNKETFRKFNNGEPDVVFMVYDPAYFGQYSTKDAKVARSYAAAVRAQDAEIAQMATAGVYQQAAAAPGPRGGIDIRRMVIMLTKASDRTTLWHEFVHFFLHMYTEAAVNGRASERQLNDLDLLLKWFKIDGETPAERLAKWSAMTLDQKRKHHEALTYNAEIYAFEGKAPSAELIPVFERLRAFMLRVYKSIRDDLNAIYRREFGEDLPILTGEVRQVMDRMLATDEQIKRQAAINEMKPQFQTQEQSGMDDAEWAAYQAMQQEAIEASITDMNKASMRQLQWLGNARSRILRDMQKKHDAKRKEVAAEVAAELRVEPVYRAMTYLRTGKFIDSDGAEVTMEGPHRLDTKRVQAIYAGLPTEKDMEAVRATGMAMPKVFAPDIAKLGTGKYGMLGVDGLDPDVVAETFGFGSGDQMIRALLEAKPIKEAVAERTDAEMLRRYGDMNTPEAQEAEVQKALHNEARARFVAVELRHVARATEPVRVMLEAAKQVARELIAGMTLREVRPADFIAAEARAARDAGRMGTTINPAAVGQAAQTRAYNEAIEAGTDPAEAMAAAIEKGAEAARKAQERSDALKAQYGADPQQALIRAKRAQLYQNQLAAEALRVREEVAKQVKYLRRILRDTNVKAMGAQAADQIAALLERFEVAPVSLKRLDERKALETWLDEQEAAGLVPDIAPEVANEARRVNYQQLTVAEFRDLVDAIRQIEFIGKNERKVQLAAERAAYEEKRDEIVTRIRAVGRLRGVKFDPRSPLTNIGRSAAALRGFAAQHLKAASVARILDGGEDDGPLWTFAIRSANAAADMETRMRAEASAKMAEILAPVFALGNMGGKGVFFPSINLSLNREARIAIAMNVGNDGNRQRLLDGEGWTMEQVQPVLESMTEAEWKAVQQVWDYIDTYRPLIAEKERRLYGKEPEWVKPTPFTTRTADGREVRLEGGYYPIKYDPVASHRVATLDEVKEAKRALDGAYTAATTQRSFTKSRAAKPDVGPLLYTLDAAFGGINDVIHDLSWHEWLIQTQRLLRDPEFKTAVTETRGPEFLKQLKDWANDNAAGERKIGVAGEAALSWLRQGISASGLGFNVVSAAMQVTGFNQSIVRLGAKYVGRGVAQFAASPIDTARMVADKSSFMAERGRTQFREINEIRNRVRGQTEVARRVTAGTYFLMMNMQRTVDIPTWLAGYQKALDAGKDDATAVALADQAVRDTQGSGLISDLAAIERGGPVMKLFTVFYSYMNTVYNMTAVQTMTARGKGKLAADYAMLLVVPVVLGQAIKNLIQPDAGDDELDPEALARKLAAEELSFLMGTMVIAREFGGAAQLLTGAEGVRMGYGGPAGLRAVGEVYGLATQAGQLEFDRAFRRSAINTLGAFTGLPSAQVNRTIDGIEAVVEGEVDGVGAVVAPLTGVQR